MAAAGMYDCFELGGLLASLLQKEVNDAVAWTEQAQHSLRKYNIAKAAPEVWECQETSG